MSRISLTRAASGHTGGQQPAASRRLLQRRCPASLLLPCLCVSPPGCCRAGVLVAFKVPGPRPPLPRRGRETVRPKLKAPRRRVGPWVCRCVCRSRGDRPWLPVAGGTVGSAEAGDRSRAHGLPAGAERAGPHTVSPGLCST